ncbi:HAMP domain-containing histidine kinase [Flavobacterium jejuense]|uniref:histidine kinase n=1 Tax=Flavobacterium jejuense TaxID=1544455 RepID=A0ABX0IXB6_9FLAO|nr:HAMP domain-containing sensor histidine kinase [Flavobacterium jejuense]NHN27811.1 HAMP domain-containing histidine kinase [Flavobacterium jejuense]
MNRKLQIAIKKKTKNLHLVLWFAFLFSCFSINAQIFKDKKVLLLNSYHPQYAWTDNFTNAVSDELNKFLEEEGLYIEYLDGRHMIDNQLYFESLVTFYKQKYANIKFDLIISSDDYALEFLMSQKNVIFQNSPVVFGGINDLAKLDQLDNEQFTGIFEGLPVLENLDLIAQTYPKATTIYILSDQTTQGKEMSLQAKKQIKEWSNKEIKISIKDNFSYDELLDESESIEPNSAYFLLAIHQDKNGKYFSYHKDLPNWSKKSKIPIYGMWGTLLIGYGATGGYINDPYTHGIEVSKIALEVLRGKRINTITPKLQTEYLPRFDFNQLEKYNINKKDLPKESILYFKPKSFYSKHKEVINTALFLITSLILLIIFLIFIIRKQKKYNLLLNSLSKELQRINEHMSNFSYMTSHQLRASSINMSMLLDYYQDNSLDESQKKWTFEKLKSTSYKIENTVNDITKILNHQEIKYISEYEKIELTSFFESVLLQFKTILEKNDITVNLNFKSKEEIFSHRSVLKEIISILIENSIKYRPQERLLIIDIDLDIRNHETLIIIKDNGDGLPEHYEKRIFKLYQRGHKNIDGNGVGLYMAKLLAHSIHANIEHVKKQNENGTTFYIILTKRFLYDQKNTINR